MLGISADWEGPKAAGVGSFRRVLQLIECVDTSDRLCLTQDIRQWLSPARGLTGPGALRTTSTAPLLSVRRPGPPRCRATDGGEPYAVPGAKSGSPKNTDTGPTRPDAGRSGVGAQRNMNARPAVCAHPKPLVTGGLRPSQALGDRRCRRWGRCGRCAGDLAKRFKGELKK
jgi:hypothetical protein